MKMGSFEKLRKNIFKCASRVYAACSELKGSPGEKNSVPEVMGITLNSGGSEELVLKYTISRVGKGYKKWKHISSESKVKSKVNEIQKGLKSRVVESLSPTTSSKSGVMAV